MVSKVLIIIVTISTGKLGILDYDEVEINNLHRQFLHNETSLGASKVESVKSFANALNSDVVVVTHHALLDSSNAMEILKDYDVVVDATDNVATRYLLNDACVLLKKPLVSGSALMFEGQLTVYNFNNGPCYRCIFPKPPPPETVTNCGDGGVFGAITSVIGSLQAMEVLKIVLGKREDVLAGTLLLYDGIACSFRRIKLRGRKENCDICGTKPTLTQLIDYEQFCGMKASDKDAGLNILREDERISVSDYKNLDESHILIDVRSEAEFEICKLEKSVNVPIKRLLGNQMDAEFVEKLRNEKVFVVCRRGNDSQLAVRHLAEKQDIKSKDVIGGLHAWTREIDSDFPIY